MAQIGGKLTPNLDQQGTKTLNLTVLQRMDPSIGEILITAAHVTFYEFNIDSNQWSRKDVEGSLFVVKRNAQPRFQFIVMNRRNTDNLVEDLLGDFEYEVQLPYLLYRKASQEVNGIWFYNPRECEEVGNLFDRIVNAYAKKPKVPSSKSEFEELEAVPSMSVIEGPLEPPSTASAATDGPEESAFNNFFSTALNIGSNPSNAANSRPLYHSSSTLPLASHGSGIISPPPLTPQVSSIPLSTLHLSAAMHENLDPVGGNYVANLVKPSSFLSPPPSSPSLMVPHIASPLPTASSLHPPVTSQRTYGTPVLQPFPPPIPPQSLTPSTPAASFITREKVQDALMMLVQDDRFVDMFHQALVKSQQHP